MKNPVERKGMPQDVKNMDRDTQDTKKQQHRQGEPLGQGQKKTIQFDEGQKFTSDEDIKRRTA